MNDPAASDRGESWTRRRSRRSGRPRPSRFLAEWWIELLTIVLVALGIFLMFERLQIRRTLWAWLQQGLRSLTWVGTNTYHAVLRIVRNVTLSDLMGVAFLAMAFGLLAWRTRRRLMTSPQFTVRLCPRCGAELHRVHRHWPDRVLDRFVPVRRFHCRDRECGWEGLRFGRSRHE